MPSSSAAPPRMAMNLRFCARAASRATTEREPIEPDAITATAASPDSPDSSKAPLRSSAS